MTFTKEYSEYIPASFVRWLESGGARVIAIHYDTDEVELRHLFDSINGLLLTGGEILDVANSTYGKTARKLFQWAMESYDAGQEFPIYGTCQGIQLLSMLTSGNSEIKEDCKATLGISKPLHFTEHARESRLFSSLSPQLYDMLATKPCGEHLHSSCITTKAFKEHKGLRDMFNVLVVNHDAEGLEFVSCVEGKRYPFYASQFHPERAGWEWNEEEQIDHSPEVVLAFQHLASFLVSEACKNDHRFVDRDEEERRQLYNTPPHLVATQKESKMYVQTYFWKHGERCK